MSSHGGVAARRYGAALADVTLEQGEAREVQEELSAWQLMMSANPELLEVFRNPTIDYEQKRNVLTALVARTRVRPTTANFLNVLLQNHRLAELDNINNRFSEVLDERARVTSAHVTTARALEATMQEALRQRLKDLTGGEVRIEFAVDEDLIGGVVTRIGSTVYDGSVQNQLQQFKSKLSGQR